MIFLGKVKKKLCFAQQIYATLVNYFLLTYENVYVGLSEYFEFANCSQDRFLLRGSTGSLALNSVVNSASHQA